MRVRFLLGMWCGLALVAGLTVVADDRLDLGGADDQVLDNPHRDLDDGNTSDVPHEVGDDPVLGSDGADAGGPAEVLEQLGADQVRIRGTLVELVVGDAVLEPRELGMPLTVESEPGLGNGARIAGGSVDGRAATVEWDAGRPLVISSGTALVTGEVRIELVAGRLVVRLGGAGHALAPGRYRIDTPVAVGHQGLATPRDTVELDAEGATVLEARGDAHVVIGDGTEAGRALSAIGPGSLVVAGDLEITTATGTATATRVELPAGSFEVTLTAAGDGTWRLEALAAGAATIT